MDRVKKFQNMTLMIGSKVIKSSKLESRASIIMHGF